MTREDIAHWWLERLVRGRKLPQTADPFRNPIGNRFREAIGVLVEELLGEMNRERVAGAMASIVEIRAVEAATPREALGFIFELKEIVGTDADGTRIDEMMLTAFDLYVECRERIGRARMNETRRRMEALERVMARGER